MIIGFYIYICLKLAYYYRIEKIEIGTEHIVILSIGLLKESWGFGSIFLFLLFPLSSFLHNDITFLICINSLSLFSWFQVGSPNSCSSLHHAATQDPGHGTKFCGHSLLLIYLLEF